MGCKEVWGCFSGVWSENAALFEEKKKENAFNPPIL